MTLIKVIIKQYRTKNTPFFRFFPPYTPFSGYLDFSVFFHYLFLFCLLICLCATSVKCVIICKFSYTRLKGWIVRFILRHPVLKEQLSTVRRCRWTSACGAPTAANPPHATAAVGGTDRRTDSKHCSAYYADSVKITSCVTKAFLFLLFRRPRSEGWLS